MGLDLVLKGAYYLMTQATLEKALRAMVEQYGFEQVERSLQEVGISGKQPKGSQSDLRLHSKSGVAKATATDYVVKMNLPSERLGAVAVLAERFKDKSFLPSFADIGNFCRAYGIDEPASKSRASAIPRVFKFIATMEPEEVQRILDDGLFSGPSRLGPIADAIRRNGRASRQSPLYLDTQ